MAAQRILVFGSANIDDVFQVQHIALSGETISSSGYACHAGGKGANQAIAIAKAGGNVTHAGKIGQDGLWIRDLMAKHGVHVDGTLKVDPKLSTGRALIQVSTETHDNAIVLFAGTNHEIRVQEVEETVAQFQPNDWLVLQHEINLIPEIIASAHRRGLKLVLNPAPMSELVIRSIPMDKIHVLVLNETEAMSFVKFMQIEGVLSIDSMEKNKLVDGMKQVAEQIVLRYRETLLGVIITLGEYGLVARFRADQQDADAWFDVQEPAYPCTPVDTTGAGDTFIGYFLATLTGPNNRISETTIRHALKRASIASSICCSRPGAMQSIPLLAEVVERERELEKSNLV